MTFPTVTTGSANSGGNTGSYVASLPDNLAVDDIVILTVYKDGTGAQTWPSDPAWTQLGSPTSSGAGIGSKRFRRIDGTEGWGGTGNSITITGASEGWAHAWAKITGAHTTTDPASPSSGGAGNSSLPNPPRQPTSGDLSWGTEDTLWVESYGWDGNVAHVSYPLNYDDNQTTSRWANSNGCGVAMATRNLAAANEDPGTGELGAAEQWAAFTVAVRPAPAGQTVAAGLVTETESAQAATLRETVAAGLTAETESAPAATLLRAVPAGLTAETETAQSAAITKVVPIGLVTETETAQPVSVSSGGPQEVPIGQVTETETAQSAAVSEIVAAGLTAEVETAQPTALRETVAAGLTAETETAQSAAVSKIVAAELTAETESALAATLRETVAAGLITETESAQLAALRETAAAGLTTETEASQPTAVVKVVPIGQAVETETSLPLVGNQILAVGLVTEAETAQPTALRETIAAGSTTETETALPAGIIKMVPGGLTTETETAQPVSVSSGGPQEVPIGQATEIETALPIGIIKIQVSAPSGYQALKAILDERRREYVMDRLEDRCPYDGELLLIGPNGILYCEFDGQIPASILGGR